MRLIQSIKLISRKPKSIYHALAPRIYLALYLLVLPLIASADVDSVLKGFLGYLTGGVGKTIALLAIVSVGFGCFVLGKVQKGYVLAVVIGVGIVFGASAILQTLGVS